MFNNQTKKIQPWLSGIDKSSWFQIQPIRVNAARWHDVILAWVNNGMNIEQYIYTTISWVHECIYISVGPRIQCPRHKEIQKRWCQSITVYNKDNDQVSYYYVICSYSDQFSFAFRQMTNSFVFVWTEPIAKSPTASCKKIWHKVVLL
jgi:hypothetical protein